MVFEAEKMVTANGKWFHRNCFRCVTCNNMLDSLNNNDGPDGNLYCKMCYRHVLARYSNFKFIVYFNSPPPHQI